MVYIFIFIMGAVFGSFSNLVVNRKIKEESIIKPPSHCELCGHRLGILDLIPVVSFIGLGGKCRYCKARIPIDNLIMEISCGVLALLVFDISHIARSILLLTATYLGLIIAAIDLKTFDIYLSQSMILTVIGIIYRYYFIGYDKEFWLKLIIFIIIYGLIFFLSKEGLGDGDIYYYLSLIFFIENSNITWFLLISVWLGAIAGIGIAIKKGSRKVEIPFCIYIFLSFIITAILPFRL